MPQPRVLILRAPGTNCDAETAHAFELAGGRAENVHVNRLLESPRLVGEFQILCLPGGFSYGDDVAAGKILANRLQALLSGELREFVARDKLVLGVCNGFQVLLKSGLLLPPEAESGPQATLAMNDSGRFEDRWVQLRCESSPCVFFSGVEAMYLPVAHAEGKFVVRDLAALKRLEQSRLVALRYAPLDGRESSPDAVLPYPENPNGSVANVAGVCDPTGRVCGLMPHPERYVDTTQHPRWTRMETPPEEGAGLAVFHNAVGYFV